MIYSSAISFRPQQGLAIMNNVVHDLPVDINQKKQFPSPTGVTYYESEKWLNTEEFDFRFPSPTGVNYYERVVNTSYVTVQEFPSPTEVNYYEF